MIILYCLGNQHGYIGLLEIGVAAYRLCPYRTSFQPMASRVSDGISRGPLQD